MFVFVVIDYMNCCRKSNNILSFTTEYEEQFMSNRVIRTHGSSSCMAPTLNDEEQDRIRAIKRRKRFVREQRIAMKTPNGIPVDHVGKGKYHVIIRGRPDETIAQVHLRTLHRRHGGYIRLLHEYRRGNDCDLEILQKYESSSNTTTRFGVGGGVEDAGPSADLHLEADHNNGETMQSTINDKGKTNCDILIYEIGGRSNGWFCFYHPSEVYGYITVMKLHDDDVQYLNELS